MQSCHLFRHQNLPMYQDSAFSFQETDYKHLGGTRKHIWMWSGIRCLSKISSPFWRLSSCRISPTRRLNFPYSFFWRYFGIITIWYLQSHLTCDKLVQLCNGLSSYFPFGTFRKDEPTAFLTGSVEPFWVLRQRRRFYFIINKKLAIRDRGCQLSDGKKSDFRIKNYGSCKVQETRFLSCPALCYQPKGETGSCSMPF